MAIIYCARNGVDNKCYVGQTTQRLNKRWRNHCSKGNNSTYLFRAIQKYGKDAFILEVLEVCEEENLNDRECHWIAALDCVSPNGYNLAYGGLGGGRRSEATRRKLSESHKGFKPSAETRRKLSEAGKGRKLSDEAKASISRKNKGRTHTPEVRARLSRAHKGRKKKPFTPEHIENMRKAWIKRKAEKRNNSLQGKLF